MKHVRLFIEFQNIKERGMQTFRNLEVGMQGYHHHKAFVALALLACLGSLPRTTDAGRTEMAGAASGRHPEPGIAVGGSGGGGDIRCRHRGGATSQ